jgi:N6-L-threonylcarbamoyladenine synthase
VTLYLGLETSCDETSAAVVEDGRRVHSSVIASQADLHARYGGVVPELAARRHLEAFLPAVDQALKEAGVSPGDLDGIAVTVGPGLAGALVVGLAGASALALAWGKPLTPVNHLEAHAYAAFLRPTNASARDRSAAPVPPLVVLIVSGGHTSLAVLQEHVVFELLGETRDDAAGEAFDKVARHLGLGYPGGPVIDRLASEGDPGSIAFPRTRLEPGSLDFSFSGLKTAVLYHAGGAAKRGETLNLPDVAASFQAAVVDVLVDKAFAALKRQGHSRLAVVGGVAANRGLRLALVARAEAEGVELYLPEPVYCTDNAAMVAGLAYYLVRSGRVSPGPVGQGPALRISPAAGLGGRTRRRGRRPPASAQLDALGGGYQGTTVRR